MAKTHFLGFIPSLFSEHRSFDLFDPSLDFLWKNNFHRWDRTQGSSNTFEICLKPQNLYVNEKEAEDGPIKNFVWHRRTVFYGI